MIVTITMNPAMDKTILLDSFQVGELNRVKTVTLDSGGKGINVSKNIKMLGGETLATGFLAGNTGSVINQMLQSQGIKTDFIFVPGETRTNMKIVDTNGSLTELNECGPEIPQKAMEKLLIKLEKIANSDTFFILTGSVPQNINKNIYKNIIQMLKKKGATVFMDADGLLFSEGIEALPNFIKPNRFELEQYFKMSEKASEEELIKMGLKLQEKGIETVLISMGSEGAIFIIKNKVFRVLGLKVEAYSPVGAGDAMVAAFSYGLFKKMPIEGCIRLAVATSAGAVETIGTKPATKSVIEQLMRQVRLIEQKVYKDA